MEGRSNEEPDGRDNSESPEGRTDHEAPEGRNFIPPASPCLLIIFCIRILSRTRGQPTASYIGQSRPAPAVTTARDSRLQAYCQCEWRCWM